MEGCHITTSKKNNGKLRVQPVLREQNQTFVVIGAGNGGQSMAGHLALAGQRVRLYDRNPKKVEIIQQQGGIRLKGCLSGFGALAMVTNDLAKAIQGASIIMIVVPAFAHKQLAQACAPYLTDGQIVVLHPGRTGGALEFYKYATAAGRNIVVAEAQTLLYACRSIEPGLCHIYGIKRTVTVAALPGYETPRVARLLRSALPQFVPGDNVLKTSLANIGAVFHPTITALNLARIESTNDFEFYTEGVTHSVAKVIEQVDSERVAIAAALGLHAITAREWLYRAYNVSGPTLYDAIHATTAYKGIKAPSTLQHRYLSEDVPMGLVPLSLLGAQVGVLTPTINHIIYLASLLHGINYVEQGRTVFDMGLGDLDTRSVLRFVMEGEYIDENETETA